MKMFRCYHFVDKDREKVIEEDDLLTHNHIKYSKMNEPHDFDERNF